MTRVLRRAGGKEAAGRRRYERAGASADAEIAEWGWRGLVGRSLDDCGLESSLAGRKAVRRYTEFCGDSDWPAPFFDWFSFWGCRRFGEGLEAAGGSCGTSPLPGWLRPGLGPLDWGRRYYFIIVTYVDEKVKFGACETGVEMLGNQWDCGIYGNFRSWVGISEGMRLGDEP